MSYRAFQGANGWYCARVRDDGSHRQPHTASQTKDEAWAEAAQLNAGAPVGDDDVPEYWGGTEEE